MSNGEQRHFPRLPVQQTRIHNGLLTGQVVNLSLGGLAMESTTGLRIGSLHGFRIKFAQRTFRVEGRICWCRLTRTVRRQEGEVVPIFRTGITFTQTPVLFSGTELQSTGEWLDLAIRVE
jgi:hypothetical protein